MPDKKVFINSKKKPEVAEKTAVVIKNDSDFTNKMAKEINNNKALKVRATSKNGVLFLSALNSDQALTSETADSEYEASGVNSAVVAFLVSVASGVVANLIYDAIKYGFNRLRPNQQQAQDVSSQGEELQVILINQ
ncbi:hypothetical protein HA050_04975 [Iodobacter sp. HSC-16F04]|uniref:Uncharacterized protein n=1 Tax=Iodobacter violaceini TaxID=3044271 RepID=A0ABX0KTM3_9NEIS|nr:hypothetical protein [Iodobacter violacea]NHQ85467.1 hypothetical protein [Iodobacter violacea]